MSFRDDKLVICTSWKFVLSPQPGKLAEGRGDDTEGKVTMMRHGNLGGCGSAHQQAEDFSVHLAIEATYSVELVRTKQHK